MAEYAIEPWDVPERAAADQVQKSPVIERLAKPAALKSQLADALRNQF